MSDEYALLGTPLSPRSRFSLSFKELVLKRRWRMHRSRDSQERGLPPFTLLPLTLRSRLPIGISARTVVRGTNQSAVPPEGLIKKFFSNNGERLLLGQASKLVAARAKCEECLPPSLSVPFFRAVAPMQFVRPLRLLTFAAAQRQIGS